MATIIRGLVAFTLAAQGETASQKGHEVHCINNRPHLLHYDLEGEETDGSSLKGVRQAIISVERSLSSAHADHCSKAELTAQLGKEHTPEGDKDFCLGAHTDSSCKAAKGDIPIKDGFVCKDCFVSADADLFYKLNYTMTHLHSVEVGLRNINLRASAGIQKKEDGMKVISDGTIAFPGSNTSFTLIDKMVGCPLCVKVKIQVAFPTSLDYSLTLSGDGEFDAGAGMDIDLGHNVIKYDAVNGTGWRHEVDNAKISTTPLLSADMKTTADLKLDVKTSLQVNVDDIIWYHLNMSPTLDTKVTFEEKSLFHNDRVCVNGDAALEMNQEANLDWNLKVWEAKDHWGPKELYKTSDPGAIKGCRDISPKSTAVVV